MTFFYKKQPEKPATTSQSTKSAPLMVKPTIKLTRLTTKQKQNQPVNSASK